MVDRAAAEARWEFGESVAKLRQKATRKMVAKFCGVSPYTVRSWEQGEGKPKYAEKTLLFLEHIIKAGKTEQEVDKLGELFDVWKRCADFLDGSPAPVLGSLSAMRAVRRLKANLEEKIIPPIAVDPPPAPLIPWDESVFDSGESNA